MTRLPDWARVIEQGTGRVEQTPDGIRLLRPAATERDYSNAELTDRDRRDCRRPPLTLAVQARFSHPVDRLRGTAGFGFWNAGIGPAVRRIHPPRAVWFFFGGPPYNVPLALDVPGNGFKAAILDAGRPAFLALLPFAPIGFLLMRAPALSRRLWPVAQRAIGVEEAPLNDLDVTAFHTYMLRWERRGVAFAVDGREVLRTSASPRSPLRFVAWIDNGYAIATPQGPPQADWGLVAESEPQWLDLAGIEITASA